MRWDRTLTVARIDLSRLFKSKDYWIPLMMLATLCFVLMPLLALGVVGTLANTTLAQPLAALGRVLGEHEHHVARKGRDAGGDAAAFRQRRQLGHELGHVAGVEAQESSSATL